MAEADQIIPVFKIIGIPNEAASKKAGRPIVDDMEVVELRYPGDRQKVSVFPATEDEPNATRAAAAEGGGPVSYAEVFSKQYRQFKDRTTQTVAGTPLSELEFLSVGKRAELRALNIQTAEQLAALDGQPLKQLGMGGRELKTQAKAYLDHAAGSADVTEQAAMIASLREQLAAKDQELRAASEKATKANKRKPAAEPDDEPEPETENDEEGTEIEQLTNDQLKEYIKRETGEGVRGNPSRETLIERATDLATRPDTDK